MHHRVLVALSVVWGAAGMAVAQPAPAPAFVDDYTVIALGTPPGVPAALGGLTMLAGDPDTLYVAGGAETAEGAIYTIELQRDGAGRIIGFVGDAAQQATAPGLHGGGINGSLINFYSDHLTYITNDDCFGGLFAHFGQPEWIQDLAGGFGDGAVVAHAVVPCGFPAEGHLKIVTDAPAVWHQAEYFITQAGWIIIGLSPDPVTTLDGGPRSIVYVDGSSKGFDGFDVALIAKREAARIDAYLIDDLANPIGASVVPFVIDIANVEGMVVDPQTKDLLVSTSSADGTDGNEIFIVRGFEPCPFGDLNGDRWIGPEDLAILLDAWGDCDDCWIGCTGPNLNCDCDVDAEDLAILLDNWGPCR